MRASEPAAPRSLSTFSAPSNTACLWSHELFGRPDESLGQRQGTTLLVPCQGTTLLVPCHWLEGTRRLNLRRLGHRFSRAVVPLRPSRLDPEVRPVRPVGPELERRLVHAERDGLHRRKPSSKIPKIRFAFVVTKGCATLPPLHQDWTSCTHTRVTLSTPSVRT